MLTWSVKINPYHTNLTKSCLRTQSIVNLNSGALVFKHTSLQQERTILTFWQSKTFKAFVYFFSPVFSLFSLEFCSFFSIFLDTPTNEGLKSLSFIINPFWISCKIIPLSLVSSSISIIA